ncbi:MAG: host-nuclease inhibitor Gam family protein [Syntrophobacteraceae bacterium]|nr:host-nuclease inhibitor Gam family protein [Desulfobacteraceae bacterium]
MKTLDTWPDVDATMEEMGRTDLEIAEVEADLGRRLYDLINVYGGRLSSLRTKRSGLEALIAAYCLHRKHEFARKRSRQLTFGKIAFRVAEKIEIPSGLEGTVIATLKRLGFGDCVEVRERIDRSALRKLPDVDLARCGVRRVREDHFRIEPNIELACGEAGGDHAPAAFSVDLERLSGAVKIREAEPGRTA